MNSLRQISLIILCLTFSYSAILGDDLAIKTGNPADKNPKGQELQSGFYVVVGSFNIYENAQRWTKDLSKRGYSCNFVFSETHNRYYVYLNFSTSLESGRQQLYKVREISAFKDSWILKIGSNFNEKRINEDALVSKEAKVYEDEEDIEGKEEIKDKKSPTHHPHKDLLKTHNSYLVYINPIGSDGKSILSTVKVVDGEKAIQLKTISSQKYEVISCPKSYSQVVEFICDNVIGYRKKVFYVDLSNPVNDTTKIYVQKEGDKIIINLRLDRLQEGDIMTMYNVFFFPNTNILRAKSNYELQKLLEMLKDNPNLKVMIHGHVNGTSSGPITRVQEDADDLFNPSETTVMNASAKKLSELRSETIRHYLINNGISPDRLQTQGWGGKKMLHKEDSPQYQYNVRVEIEILAD